MGNTLRSISSSASSSTKSSNMNAESIVKEAISKHPVVIFSKTYCPFCHTAKSEIAKASSNVANVEEAKIFELDTMGDLGYDIQMYLGSLTGRRTVPNVFIGGVSVGGGDEVESLANSGILKQMLSQASTKLQADKQQVKKDDEFNIDNTIQKYPVVIFSKTWCPFCTQAKQIIEEYAKKINGYKESKVIELDTMGEKGQIIQQKLHEKTGQRTVPNIFINAKHIGGCDDLMSKLDSLPSLLQSAYANSPTTKEATKEVVVEGENVKEIVLGAGCFWGVELAFQRQEGVLSTEVGYSNGKMEGISYDAICTGMTGAAEVVKVKYDENVVNLKHLLHVWNSRHDVTSLNKQGNDVGTQYRSAIYYTDDSQKAVIDEFISELSGKVSGEIVSDVKKVNKYSKAEDYHQQYLEKKGQSAKKGDTTRIRCYG